MSISRAKSVEKTEAEEKHFSASLSSNIDSLMLAEDQLTFGDKLGTGSFATVYQSTFNGKPVAIKKYDFSKEHVQENIDTKKIATILKDINTCPYFVTLVGWTKESIVTELMPEGALDDALNPEFKKRKFNHEALLQIAIDVCAGLEFLHEKKLVHQDIKAGNILLDSQFRAKIADTDMIQPEEKCGDMAGTPGSIAPEVLESGHATISSDMYSLGILLLEIFLKNFELLEKTVAKRTGNFLLPLPYEKLLKISQED